MAAGRYRPEPRFCPVINPESNIDKLLKARAEIDQELRRHKVEVTILFTDVVGSTSYFERYGDTAGLYMVTRHAEHARKCFEQFQGRVIKTIGDSVMAEFPEPALGVRAALELQRQLFTANQAASERDRLQLRIGIHSGMAFRHDNDVFGDAVNVAARVTKHTGPAQICISSTTHEAISGLPEFRCRPLGKITFHGKSEPDDVFEVIWTDTAAYSQLRRNLTLAVKKGDLVAPGMSPSQLLDPMRTPTPTPTPTVSATPPPVTTPPPTATPPPTPIGTPIGTTEVIDARYELLGTLGQGGMGSVYKARDRDTEETIALKVLRPEIAADPSVLERFKNELRVARRITHRNVCRIHDLHRTGNTNYISMEYVEGQSLRHILEKGPMRVAAGLRMSLQICAGLAEAHAQGVIHRDLKPENVMVDRGGVVKLMDFGIARTSSGSVTLTGMIIGTPAYMSPEQAEGKPIDIRSDIYSLGLVLYEIFTGQAAFSGDTPVAIALKQIREHPTPPRELAKALPETVEEVILKCIQKSPADRYQSVRELEFAINALLAGATDSSQITPPPMPAVAARTGAITASGIPTSPGLTGAIAHSTSAQPAATQVASAQTVTAAPAAKSSSTGILLAVVVVGLVVLAGSGFWAYKKIRGAAQPEATTQTQPVQPPASAPSGPTQPAATEPTTTAPEAQGTTAGGTPSTTPAEPPAEDAAKTPRPDKKSRTLASNQPVQGTLNLGMPAPPQRPVHHETAAVAPPQPVSVTPRRFTFLHPHAGSQEGPHCMGVLTITEQGLVRYDCINASDGRCDRAVFAPGVVAGAHMNGDGSLSIGGMELYSTRKQVQEALETLQAAASLTQGR